MKGEVGGEADKETEAEGMDRGREGGRRRDGEEYSITLIAEGTKRENMRDIQRAIDREKNPLGILKN